MREPIRLDEELNTATAGLELAAVVLDAARQDVPVVLDFSGTERMTPSFANAFVMTLLEAVGVDGVRRSVQMRDRNPNVHRAISTAARRYAAGIRLSTQEAAMA